MALGRKTGGRTKGTPNKTTPEKRRFMQAFIEQTQDEAFACWHAIKDPVRKFDLWVRASEFCHPKLGRTEVVGDGGGGIVVEVKRYTEE